MMEEFKKIFLLGIGAASITYEKSMEIINDMVKKGKLTLEEGKQIGDELRKTMKIIITFIMMILRSLGQLIYQFVILQIAIYQIRQLT